MLLQKKYRGKSEEELLVVITELIIKIENIRGL